MCTPTSHVFIFSARTTTAEVPIGLRCVCGAERWGTAAELAALDEVAQLEALLAVPWRQPTKGVTP